MTEKIRTCEGDLPMASEHRSRKDYTVGQLLATGSRFYVDEYSEDDAIEDYLSLHPEAVEADVRAELTRELGKLLRSGDREQ
ncbi:hypothetical protein [Nevskia ramosa]|uniref:hypothetical protein n=1 Tax=Nevskia ramosa TaxID=64002 RepID=UPI003D147F88